MNIAISGSSGYIGNILKKTFLQEGYRVVAIRRADLNNKRILEGKIEKSDCIIILNGSSIFKRWSKKNWNMIYKSRIVSMKRIYDCIHEKGYTNKTIISASGVGGYEVSNFASEGSVLQNNKLGELIREWESFSAKGNRSVYLRLGVVIGKRSPFVKRLSILNFFRFGVVFKNRAVNFSFVHETNLVRAVNYVIKNINLEGAVNVVEPKTLSYYCFLKKYFGNIVFVVVGERILKLLFGRALVLL